MLQNSPTSLFNSKKNFRGLYPRTSVKLKWAREVGGKGSGGRRVALWLLGGLDAPDCMLVSCCCDIALLPWNLHVFVSCHGRRCSAFIYYISFVGLSAHSGRWLCRLCSLTHASRVLCSHCICTCAACVWWIIVSVVITYTPPNISTILFCWWFVYSNVSTNQEWCCIASSCCNIRTIADMPRFVNAHAKNP